MKAAAAVETAKFVARVAPVAADLDVANPKMSSPVLDEKGSEAACGPSPLPGVLRRRMPPPRAPPDA